MNGVVFEVVDGQTWVPIDKNYGDIFSPGRMGISPPTFGKKNAAPSGETLLQMVASVGGLMA